MLVFVVEKRARGGSQPSGQGGQTHVGDPEFEVALVVAVLILGVAAQVAEAPLINFFETRRVATGGDGLLGPLDIAARHPIPAMSALGGAEFGPLSNEPQPRNDWILAVIRLNGLLVHPDVTAEVL